MIEEGRLAHTNAFMQTCRAYLKVLVAFTPAEVEHAGIVAHKSNAVAGVDAATAKPTLLDAHGAAAVLIISTYSKQRLSNVLL